MGQNSVKPNDDINWNWKIIDGNENYIKIRVINTNTNEFVGWGEIFSQCGNKIFIDGFINSMTNSNPFGEFYLEFNPITYSSINNTIFEFVLIKTNGFAPKADIYTFGQELLDTDSNEIISFPNPSNTAILVVPCYNHSNPIDDYLHIGTFMRSKCYKQKKNLVKMMFGLYFDSSKSNSNPNQKLWLSTHGKGVGWLHVRIDKTPRYISWNQYK